MGQFKNFEHKWRKILLLAVFFASLNITAAYRQLYGNLAGGKSLVGKKYDYTIADSSEENEESCARLPPKYSNSSGSLQFTHLNLVSLLKHGTDLIDQSKYVDKAILILGNTGSGKTTISQILSGNLDSLHAVVTDSDRLVIIDDNFKISGPSTTSKTLIPELVIEEDGMEQGVNTSEDMGPTMFYDCPGFDDTRGPEEDLAANFFVNHVVRRKVNQIKMLFLVIHSSVKLGNDRLDFDLLASHAVKFVKNLDKFQDSIGLVVTKVNSYNARGKYIPDKTILKEILEFIHLYINAQHEKLAAGKMSSDERTFIEKKIKFVEILLQRNKNGEHCKITFSRDSEKCGPLSQSRSVAQTRKRLQNLYKNELVYTPSNYTDFGYTLKDSTALSIRRVSNNVNNEISNSLRSTIAHIEQWVEEVQFSNKRNFTESLSIVENISMELSKLVIDLEQQNSSALTSSFSAKINVVGLTKLLKGALQRIGYHVSSRIEHFMEKQQAYIEFFEADDSIKVLETWLQTVKSLRDDYVDLQNWCRFCQNLEHEVASYAFQREKPVVADALFDNKSSSDWLRFLEMKTKISVSSEVNHAAKQFDGKKREYFSNKLVEIMDYAMRNSSIVCASRAIQVIGNFVRVSEFTFSGDIRSDSRRICPSIQKIERLEVYASHTIFIDKNIDAVGQELNVVIIAPNWKVVGLNKFNLQGINGTDITSKARSGRHGYGENGDNGDPGMPGGPGGSMFGVAERVETGPGGGSLLVNCDGGKGGRGQDGGDGGDGLDGRPTAYGSNYKNQRDTNILWVYVKDRIEYTGHSGLPGGNGGYGGSGGDSGLAGQFSLNMLGKQTNKESARIIVGSQNRGKTGEDGAPGMGGRGGKPGDALNCYKHRVVFFRWENCERVSARASEGRNGANWFDIFNTDGSESSKPPNYSIVKWQSLSKFQQSFYGYRDQQNATTRRFIEMIDRNPFIMGDISLQLQFYMSEFQYLDKYSSSVDYEISLYTNFIEKLERQHMSRVYFRMDFQHKKMFNLLTTAAYSKLVTLKQGSCGLGYVLDIQTYLINVKQQLQRYSNDNITESVVEICAKYQISLQRKAMNLRDFMNNVANLSIVDAITNQNQELEALRRKFTQLLNDSMDEVNWENMMWQIKRGKDIQETLGLKQAFQAVPFAVNVIKFLASEEVLNFLINPKTVTNSSWSIQMANELLRKSSKILENTELLTPTHTNSTVARTTKREIATEYIGPSITNHLYDVVSEDSNKLSRLEELVEHVEKLAIDAHDRKIIFEQGLISLIQSIRSYLNLEQGRFEDSLWKATTRWQIKNHLQTSKENLRNLADGIDSKIYSNLFERLQDAITLTIDLYDNMEQYQNIRRFTGYLALVNSTTEYHRSSDLAVSQLRAVIGNSVLNREYLRALHAFRQWVFPFAGVYSEEKSLPSRTISIPFQEMQAYYVRKVEKLETVVTERQRMTTGAFRQTNFNNKTFFVWESSRWSSEIKNLLAGKIVYLKADIMKARDVRDVVKFNFIELVFKAKNRDSGELNKVLKNFRVSMTPGDVAYYKLRNNFYVMIGSPNQTIQYDFEKVEGNYVGTNEMYEKLKSGDYQMSPYTLWAIQLDKVDNGNSTDNGKNDFEELQRWAKWVDIELVGNGSYVDIANDLDLEVDRYYEQDSSLREEDLEFDKPFIIDQMEGNSSEEPEEPDYSFEQGTPNLE